jgi:hypothetical protein
MDGKYFESVFYERQFIYNVGRNDQRDKRGNLYGNGYTGLKSQMDGRQYCDGEKYNMEHWQGKCKRYNGSIAEKSII